MGSGYRRQLAVAEFRDARRKAALSQLLARLNGRPVALLSYDDVLERLPPLGSSDRGLKEIPLAAIAGSVGRTRDFTRDFLPRHDSDEDRWVGVRAATTDPGSAGLPPIQVYQVGDAYFVLDGHHRVSVARQLGASTIQAYVTEVQTKVPLSPGVDLAELVLKSEYADFLAATQLDVSRPGARLQASAPGRMALMLERVRAFQGRLAAEGDSLDTPASAARWYDEEYLAVVGAIREIGLPRDFPEQTEADLYALVAAHLAAVEGDVGWKIKPEVGASRLAEELAAQRAAPAVRAGRRLISAVVPPELRDGPPVGQWRRQKLASRYGDRLFADVLVALTAELADWRALDQALQIARREGAALHGLHVARTGSAAESARQALAPAFAARCQAAGVAGQFAAEPGAVVGRLCERSTLNDLLVVNLKHPPSERRLARLDSGFRALIRRCPRPVLAVPGAARSIGRVLVAYDGSPKAHEALFVAAYMGEAWGAQLVVVTIGAAPEPAGSLFDEARAYLDLHELSADFIARAAPSPGQGLLAAAADLECDLIAIGGYGARPVVEVVIGSVVDEVLRGARLPVLICR
jgi:nucleotide-binding universal stress UspA family protein